LINTFVLYAKVSLDPEAPVLGFDKKALLPYCNETLVEILCTPLLDP